MWNHEHWHANAFSAALTTSRAIVVSYAADVFLSESGSAFNTWGAPPPELCIFVLTSSQRSEPTTSRFATPTTATPRATARQTHDPLYEDEQRQSEGSKLGLIRGCVTPDKRLAGNESNIADHAA